MNTRLQVEHPVTEMITGLDLVEWQLRVAAGQPLLLAQEQIVVHGHAMEARIYAEDPARDFLPSIGVLTHLRVPVANASVRIDTGVRAGDTISSFYDPMIAKLIVHGEDREVALRRLAASLASFEVAGVQTNLRLLRGIAANAAFAAAALDTGLIARDAATLLAPADAPSPMVLVAAVFALLDMPAAGGWRDPWTAEDSWRMNLEAMQSIVLQHADSDITLAARREGERLTVLRDGLSQTVTVRRDGAVLRCRAGGESHAMTIQRDGARVSVIAKGETYVFEAIDRLSPPSAAAAGAGRVLAPIPGRIAAVLVDVGASVVRGQKLVVLEAMKMEITLSAGVDGIVAALHCTIGAMVEEGRELIEVTATPSG